VRDTWKLGPRLTVHAGLCYEPFLPPALIDGAVYEFNLADMIAGKKTTVYKECASGTHLPGRSRFPRPFRYESPVAPFHPRVGVAWDPTGMRSCEIAARHASLVKWTAIEAGGDLLCLAKTP
jgi:hypothetical protein